MNRLLEQPVYGVEAEVQYVAAADRHLHCYALAPPDGVAESNADFRAHTVEIRDARRRERPLSLDADGAALITQQSVLRQFGDADAVRRRYYPQSAELIRAATGAAQVVVFDHNVRRSGTAARSDWYSPRRPVFHVHTDFTARSARWRAETVLGRAIAPDECNHSLCRLCGIGGHGYRKCVGESGDGPPWDHFLRLRGVRQLHAAFF